MEKVFSIGGFDNRSWLSTVEVYDVASNTWTDGVNLPLPLYGAAAIPFEDTFLVIGGRSNSTFFNDKVYRYNRQDSTWMEMPELRLSEGKYGIVAMWVP